MAKPDKVKPGDVLLYKNHGIVGTLVGWFSWDGGRGNNDYSHISQVLTDITGYEQNPKESRMFSLDTVNWDMVDVFRFNIDGVNPYDNPENVAKLKSFDESRVGTPYDFGFIGEALGAGILARIGLQSLAQKWIHNTTRQQHRSVCSIEIEHTNEETLGINLFPEFLDTDTTKPSDWAACRYLVRV